MKSRLRSWVELSCGYRTPGWGKYTCQSQGGLVCVSPSSFCRRIACRSWGIGNIGAQTPLVVGRHSRRPSEWVLKEWVATSQVTSNFREDGRLETDRPKGPDCDYQ